MTMAVSVRPAPAIPESPRISPRRTDRDTLWSAGRRAPGDSLESENFVPRARVPMVRAAVRVVTASGQIGSADHEPHERIPCLLGRVDIGHEPAVAKHSDGVSQAEELVEAV